MRGAQICRAPRPFASTAVEWAALEVDRISWHLACVDQRTEVFLMSASRVTTDHAEIRAWVEERGGFPAHVKSTGGSSDPGVLRIDFPGFGGEATLERIDWETWFAAFDQNDLAFLHQDRTIDGKQSRFNKLVARKQRAA